MGRTNIVIDDALVERAMRLTGARIKREVVDIALRRLVEKGEIYRPSSRWRRTWRTSARFWPRTSLLAHADRAAGA